MVGIVRAYSHFGAIGVELQYSHGLFPIYLSIYKYIYICFENGALMIFFNWWLIIELL